MTKFEFREKSLLGGWTIEVWKGPLAHIGNIRRNPALDGYSYFPGPRNELNPSHTDTDLDALKGKILASDGR
jgi:hypothetical protein